MLGLIKSGALSDALRTGVAHELTGRYSPQLGPAPANEGRGDTARPPAPARSRSASPLDRAILAAGPVAAVCSFLGYYDYRAAGTTHGGVGHAGERFAASAWTGYFGWISVLLAMAGSLAVAVDLIRPRPRVRAMARIGGVMAYASAFGCAVLAFFVVPAGHHLAGGADAGHGVGYWGSAAAVAVGYRLSQIRVQRLSSRGPQTPPSTDYPPPPPLMYRP